MLRRTAPRVQMKLEYKRRTKMISSSVRQKIFIQTFCRDEGSHSWGFSSCIAWVTTLHKSNVDTPKSLRTDLMAVVGSFQNGGRAYHSVEVGSTTSKTCSTQQGMRDDAIGPSHGSWEDLRRILYFPWVWCVSSLEEACLSISLLSSFRWYPSVI